MRDAMREVLRTNDLVLLSFARHVLSDAGIECWVLDEHVAAVEGSLFAFPRRLMVRDEDARQALELLADLAAGDQGTSRNREPEG